MLRLAIIPVVALVLALSPVAVGLAPAAQTSATQTQTKKKEKKTNPMLKKAPFVLGGIIVFTLLVVKVIKPAIRRSRKGEQGPNFRVRNDRRLHQMVEEERMRDETGEATVSQVNLAPPGAPKPASAPPPPPNDAPSTIPAGWHPDPRDPNSLRYWDGQGWTEQTQSKPNQPEQLLQGWYPDPQNDTQLRWWDGQVWSEHTRDSGSDS